MKAVLYLYPIKEYVDYSIMQESFHLNAENVINYRMKAYEINGLIDSYFRQKNYKIIYAHFNDSLNSDNDSALSKLFDFQKSDKFMDVKISFNDIKSKIYPSEASLIKSLMPLERLVVAGFHCQDCVSRFHQEALRLGINSSIEKSLTEQYFYLAKVGCNFEKRLEKY